MNHVEGPPSDRVLLSGLLRHKSYVSTSVEHDYSPGVQNRSRHVFDGATESLDSLRTSANCTGSSGSEAGAGGKRKKGK